MILLQLSAVSKSFGEHRVLSDVTWPIQSGERIGLVGANGCGKSTLLKVMSGEWTADSGSVDGPRGVRIGYLPQSARVSGDRSLYNEMEIVFSGREETEPYDYKIRRALSGVGLDEPKWGRPSRLLSGGEKCRAALARVILSDPDVLLLDEPTNHLDIAGREWLEEYLRRFAGGVVLVAHDRVLLNRATNRTAFLISQQLKLYKGSFAESRDQWESEQEQTRKLYERQQEHIARTEDFIRRNIAGQKTKQAKSRRKMLAKLERIELPEHERSGPRLGWIHAGRSRADLIRMENAAIGYDGKAIAGAKEIVLRRGEKVGVVGPNGCGKSTFLRTALGELKPIYGSVELASGTEVSYFRQEVPHDHGDLTVREHFWNAVPSWDEGQVRSWLGRFLFSQDEVLKTLKALSGGERRRLELAKLAVEPTHLLILDEPTNHLDIPAQEAVESALQEFEGSLLLVSHDRQLLDAVCEKLWVFDGGQIREFLGTYNEYVQALREAGERSQAAKPRAEHSVSESKRRRTELVRLQRRIQEAETRIKELEAELDSIDREGRDPATAANWTRLNFLATEKRKKDRELTKWLQTWDEAATALEELREETTGTADR
jgi:ATP-binding cassette subfamily F protein 3